jgi:uncharacterized protein
LQPKQFVDERFGLPTVTDILAELEKPGRDPRPAFRTATFADGVHKISDLKVGMLLEGQVTNVAAFGAFVDVGVHQDGLVHVSAMSKQFVSEPSEIVKTGDVVRVKVLEVDEARKRISLTLRLDDEPGAANGRPERGAERRGGGRPEANRGGPRRGQQAARGVDGGQQAARGADKRDDLRGGDRAGAKRTAARPQRESGGGGLGNSAMADALRRAGLTGDKKD